MSSATADPSTIRENLVPIRPRSSMIREITGMLVTAKAAANTITSDVRFCAVPSRESRSNVRPAAMPTANGTTVAASVMIPAVRAS
jgi:hypothetical protein